MNKTDSLSPSGTERKYATFTHTFSDPWTEGAEGEVELSFAFGKPTKGEIKRLQDTAAKNPAQASRNLLLSTVHPDDKVKLDLAMEEHPGIATTLSTALLKGVGISSELGN